MGSLKRGERIIMSELQIEGQDLKIGAKLAWELTAPEVIYPFMLQVGAKSSPLFVHMKPYKAEDLKQLLTDTAPAVKLEDEDTSEIVKSKPEKIASFFWKHFLRLSVNGRSDSELELEKQKQWIIGHPRFDIAHKAVLDGFGGISTKRQAAQEEETTNGNGNHPEAEIDIFSMDLEVTTSIPLTQRIYLPDAGIVPLEMQHNFRRETAAEFQRYERATDKQLIHRKRQAYQRAVNHSVIEDLYNGLIESVEGMTVNGEDCSKENRSKWVGIIPYWHKQLALMEFFSGVQSKNG